MALYGDLSDISLADLLYLVNVRHVSGRLALQSGHDDALLWFVDGNLVHVAASASAHHIGQWLVRRGRLSLDQLGEALALQANSRNRPPLGSILIERGWLSVDELSWALTDQAEDILYGVLSWPQATFNFVAVEAPPPSLPLRELNLEKIILEATRRADELAEIRRLIPTLECTVSLVNQLQMISFDTGELSGRLSRQVIAGLTHLQPHTAPANPNQRYWVTLRQIMRVTTMEESDLLRTVYDLVQRDILAIQTPTPVKIMTVV